MSRDALLVVGRTEDLEPDNQPAARMVVRGIVVSAMLRRKDDATIGRVAVTGSRGSIWMDLRWDCRPENHEHATLAADIAEGLVLAMRDIGLTLRDLDQSESAARCYLIAVAYMAIAQWQPACAVAKPKSRGFWAATTARGAAAG